MKQSFLMAITLTATCALLFACGTNTYFPPEKMAKVTPAFHFEAWRDAGPSNPAGKSDAGLYVELGGRIVATTTDDNNKGIVIVAEQLPIVQHPTYGPAEDVKRKGTFEFAFLYPGELSRQTLRNGNRFIIVGTTTGRRPVVINGTPKSEPFLVADCIHVWQTGRTEIAEFKESVGGGDSPLPETTSCVNKK